MKKSLLSLIAMGLLVVGLLSAQEQMITVTGTVFDECNDAIPGVTIVVKNTTRGIVTDIDGRYSIQVRKGETLVFSYLGYNTQEHTVRNARLDVTLHPNMQELSETVVVAYGIQTRQQEPSGRRQRVRMAETEQSKASADMGAFYYSMPQAAPSQSIYDHAGTEEYASFHENRFITVEKDPLSTFSLEVDGASYSNMRRIINQGQMPQADAIRTEELVNYFSYDYEKPTGNDLLKISYEVNACPWNAQHRLVRIGVKAREIASENMPASNLVFLIDVSGSMYGATRLELVKSSLKLLVNNLRDEDRVSIVVYAGAAGVVLPATPGSDKQKIRESLDNLTAGGSTAGGAGIQLAYQIARQNFMTGGNNRVILCTDGDFNVGVSSTQGLESLIEQERRSGVFLTLLGYGMGNYKDNRMQTLAEKGNGNYAYIDNIQEANRILVNEFGGTLYTVTKDVKLQLEFNPDKVQAYRLVGYESRLLAHEDFNDDTKDAGEIGAGHSVTALYEIVPVGVQSNVAPNIDPLKYQQREIEYPDVTNGHGEVAIPLYKNLNNYPDLLTVKMRYKAPDGDVSEKIEVAVIDSGRNNPSTDYAFAASVAMFGQLVRNSDFKGTATYDEVIALAKQGWNNDEHGYRREFVRLVESVKGMAR